MPVQGSERIGKSGLSRNFRAVLESNGNFSKYKRKVMKFTNIF